MELLHLADIPVQKCKDITYGRIVVDIRPEKAETYRTRLMAGGDRIDYTGLVSTPMAELPLIKILLNSTISTVNAKFMTIDISNFYLGTPMPQKQYMVLSKKVVPPTFWTDTIWITLSSMEK